MHSRPAPSAAPWNEVLRACASAELHACIFSMHVKITCHRLEPREVSVVLVSGQRSLDLEPVYACPCGGFAQGRSGSITVADISTATGAATFVDGLAEIMKTLRVELQGAASLHLRAMATVLHGDLLRQLAIHASRWNLPPYAHLGKTRARPAPCWHRP